ncbi:ferredoxin reductase family protein [soil metagenome]
MDRTIAGLFWLLLYLMVVMVPVFLMLVPPVPSGRPFWTELSIALGFVGLTQIGLQFLLIARFKRVTAPYGIDIILRYHRQIAIVAVAAILLHPLIIVIEYPARLELLDPFGGNWASRFALLSMLALLVIVGSSVFRERIRLDYERWRMLHVLLGVAAIVFAQLHASMAGLYINTAWKQAIWIVTAVAMVSFVVWLRLLKPAWQRSHYWTVVEVREEQGDTYTLALQPVGHDGFRFTPGQFAWIKLDDSPFTLEEHPFSFASSAERTDRIEFGIKALGDFSSAIGDVAPGSRAYLDGPHGAFSIDRYPAAAYVLFAGGVGITPFMSILRTMADRNDPRPVTLFYADKSLDDVAYTDDLKKLEEQLNLEIIRVLEEPPGEWDGEEGFITPELLDRRLDDVKYDRDYMVCGPPPMMDAVQEALLERGVPQERIQLERFALV